MMKTPRLHRLTTASCTAAVLLGLAACVQATAPSAAGGDSSASLPTGGSVDAAAMLAAHNSWRAKYGVPPLQWSAKLADVAQHWADHLASTSCTPGHSGNQYGENVYWGSPVQWSNGRSEVSPTSAQTVVDSWGNEVEYYDYSDNSCHATCGHYTQVVWKDTKEVGCGMAVCGNKAQIWICSYDPPGNAVGKKPY